MLSITIRRDLSINDLVQLARRGKSVMKTPHVGNHYPNNLLINSLECVHVVLVDQTIGLRDKNFHPHTVIAGSRSYDISRSDLLMTHARVDRDSGVVNGMFPIGERVADCHSSALKALFPDTVFELNSDLIVRHADLCRWLLETLSQDNVFASKLFAKGWWWRRWVTREGFVQTRESAVSFADVVGKVRPIDCIEEGWIIPNFFDVLISAIVQAIDSGCGDVYHLSGPDMVTYIGAMIPLLKDAYQILLENGGLLLPSSVDFNLVPVADARFAVRASRRTALESLVEAIRDVREEERERGELMRAARTQEERNRILYEGNRDKLRLELFNGLRAAIAGCPEVMYDIKDGAFLSQYDLLQGDSLWIHPWVLDTPVGDLEKAIKLLRSNALS